MSDITRQEWISMSQRLVVAETKIEHFEKNEDDVWKSITELRNLLQSQGLRLALIFGGINVVVVGIGLLVGFTTLLERLGK